MKIENEFTVHVPIDEAWKVLTDLEGIAPCLPGAQLTGVEGDTYKGKVKIKVGPVISEFAGTARFAEKDDAAHRAVIDAKGRDSRSAGNAAATITAVLRPDGDSTVVSVDTDMKISGKLAQFGSGMIKEVSQKLLGQFVTSLEAKIGTDPGASPDLAPAAAPSTSSAAAPSTSRAAAPSTSPDAAPSTSPGAVAGRLLDTAPGVAAETTPAGSDVNLAAEPAEPGQAEPDPQQAKTTDSATAADLREARLEARSDAPPAAVAAASEGVTDTPILHPGGPGTLSAVADKSRVPTPGGSGGLTPRGSGASRPGGSGSAAAGGTGSPVSAGSDAPGQGGSASLAQDGTAAGESGAAAGGAGGADGAGAGGAGASSATANGATVHIAGSQNAAPRISPAASRPREVVAADEPEPLDLMELAGGSIRKRVIPVVVGAVVLVAAIVIGRRLAR